MKQASLLAATVALLLACGGNSAPSAGAGGKLGTGGASVGGTSGAGTTSRPGTGGTTAQTGGVGGQTVGSGGKSGVGGTTGEGTGGGAAGGVGGVTSGGAGGPGGAGGASMGGAGGFTGSGGRGSGGSSGVGGGSAVEPGRDGGGGGADAADLASDSTKPARDSGGEVADAGGSDGRADGAEAGTGLCDLTDPPADVAAWINESWNAEGRNNITGHKNWLADSAMKGQGEINICVRYGATRAVSTATRDLIAPAMQRWFNKWFALLYPYACFPYPSITVKVTGWAVKPGQESLLQWTDRTVPVYTEVSDGSDQAKGEPKCPDSCGFFFHSDHLFTACPGGAANHFDYTLWMDDTLPSGNAAEGSDWGVRIPVASVFDNINTDGYWVILHEMGHAFGLSDYYSWTGSKPAGGSIMMIGSSNGLTIGDQWIVRRYWKETKSLRY